jgi:hypothetical protein
MVKGKAGCRTIHLIGQAEKTGLAAAQYHPRRMTHASVFSAGLWGGSFL